MVSSSSATTTSSAKAASANARVPPETQKSSSFMVDNNNKSIISPSQKKKKKKTLVEHFRHRGSAIDAALGISSHVGAAVTAVVELGEDLESIGHGHGMLLLVGSRLAREMNLLRTAVVEEVEELVHIKEHHPHSWLWRWPLEPFLILGRILSSQIIATVLAIAALGAAALEVVEDSRPGGHHGAVLLAINELWELIELSHVVPKRWRFLLEQHVLRLLLVTGALMVAIYESWEESTKFQKGAAAVGVGGHHGVALFAAAKILRVIALMRTEVKELTEVEEEVEEAFLEGHHNNKAKEKEKEKKQQDQQQEKNKDKKKNNKFKKRKEE